MYTRNDMPDLEDRLRTHDLGFLRIVADLWGLDLDAPDARSFLPKLTRALLHQGLVQEVVESLPDEARQAMDILVLRSGLMPWSRFIRSFGGLRDVGPGKRDREKPYLEPISSTEILWYRGLIGRDFLRREGELQECAYIPDDLMELLPPVLPTGPQPPGRPASPGETSFVILTSDRVLDHTSTLLAALRLEDPGRSPGLKSWQPPFDVVYALLASMKLITSSEQPVAEDARPFLEMSRAESLAWLVRGWRESTLFNELRLVPGLVCEGAWSNEPQKARSRVLAHLSELPEDTWWHLESFVKAIYEREPDFQRPAGDYETWLIRDAETGESLLGEKHWEQVDGALVRYLITGPMHWLGLIDLAAPSEGAPICAFRFSSWSSTLLMGQPIEDASVEDQPLEAFSDGTITASNFTPRIARYQVSRFCLWVDESEDKYTYRLTPTSLSAAADQGLKMIHLETLLNKYGQAPPPSLSSALNNWEQKGTQARIRPCTILQVETPKILQALRSSPAGRFVGDPLGPTAAIINPEAVKKVSAALMRLGYLSEFELINDVMELNHNSE